MKWTSILAIYFLFWFFALFLVLPFHGRRAGDEDVQVIPGQEPGAPVHIRPWRIVLQVTVVSALFFVGYYVAYTNDLVTLKFLDPERYASE